MPLPQMSKQRLFLIIGIVLGVIAFLLVRSYLEQEKMRAQQEMGKQFKELQAQQTSVLIAKTNIEVGKLIDPDMLESRIVMNDEKEDRAVTSAARIEGMIAAQPINRGEQITLNKLMYARTKGGLSEITPAGKRAVTISVDNIASLAGMLKPGDNVDVIASVPVPAVGPDGKQVAQVAMLPLFQNVQVLAVGQDLGASIKGARASTKSAGDASLITISLNPQEANIITFVQEQGKIRLVLRSPVDSKTEPIRPVSWDTVFQYLFPQQEAPVVREAPKPTVEIYRGMNKETVQLSD